MASDATSMIGSICACGGVDEWGVAANRGWPLTPDLPFAVSLVGRHSGQALRSLEKSQMSQAFFDDYSRLFHQLTAAADQIVESIAATGHRAASVGNLMLRPNEFPDIPDWGQAGVFAHKTAATQAGLGWIGKTALFVSARFGPAVRLMTVFTDLPLEADPPTTTSSCGRCRVCVDACPMGAGRDVLWVAGMPRDRLYEEKACEKKTYEHPEWDGTCGVCQSVCPLTRGAIRGED